MFVYLVSTFSCIAFVLLLSFSLSMFLGKVKEKERKISSILVDKVFICILNFFVYMWSVKGQN